MPSGRSRASMFDWSRLWGCVPADLGQIRRTLALEETQLHRTLQPTAAQKDVLPSPEEMV
jgi:hypothetical protein